MTVSMSASQEEEEIISDDESENPQLALKRLREKLDRAVQEKQEYLASWQRERADFANYKREEEKRRHDHDLKLKMQFAESLIPTLDSFEMALKDKTFQESDVQWKKGMEAVYAGLQKSLERIGVTRYWPSEEKFNPHTHEALREVVTHEEKQNHFIDEVERAGYSIGDRIIRPAQVSVYTYKK